MLISDLVLLWVVIDTHIGQQFPLQAQAQPQAWKLEFPQQPSAGEEIGMVLIAVWFGY